MFRRIPKNKTEYLYVFNGYHFIKTFLSPEHIMKLILFWKSLTCSSHKSSAYDRFYIAVDFPSASRGVLYFPG